MEANEKDLIRPLCLLLDFLRVDDEVDLRGGGGALTDLRWEGPGGGLELMHPCSQVLGLTKYQALFHPSAAADTVRASFFM